MIELFLLDINNLTVTVKNSEKRILDREELEIKRIIKLDFKDLTVH